MDESRSKDWIYPLRNWGSHSICWRMSFRHSHSSWDVSIFSEMGEKAGSTK